MINDYNYTNGCGCMASNRSFLGNSGDLSVEKISLQNVITVTNNRAQYYAELAKQYKNEAKELRDSAKYYSEQNADVTKSYVDNHDASLQLAIDTKQDILVSGTDIKTINSISLLGSGNIDVATSLQGEKADTALQPNDNISQLTNDSGFITLNELINKADITAVDGQWVSSYNALASNVSAPTSTDLEYDLSSILPNDGYNYEVLLSARATTGTTSGNICLIQVSTSLTGSQWVTQSQTRTASSVINAGSTIAAVGTDRKISVVAISNNTGTFTLFMSAYRRIGTNS